jgi:hypothetical protein
MQKWEYLLISITQYNYFADKRIEHITINYEPVTDNEYPDLITLLEDIGEQGWELVSNVIDDVYRQLVFKRPKQQQ